MACGDHVSCAAAVLLFLLSAASLVSAGRQLSAITETAAEMEAAFNMLHQHNHVWMSRSEQALIESYLEPTDTMLEWGSGYSTLWFAQFVKNYYSIEHDAQWYHTIKANISSSAPNVKYTLAEVNKGDGGWGGGFEEGTVEQFRDYIAAVDTLGVKKFNKVLIDGRARAGCAEHILPYLHSGSIVFIHDYIERHFYHGVVARNYVVVAMIHEGQSLVVLRPKKAKRQDGQR